MQHSQQQSDISLSDLENQLQDLQTFIDVAPEQDQYEETTKTFFLEQDLTTQSNFVDPGSSKQFSNSVITHCNCVPPIYNRQQILSKSSLISLSDNEEEELLTGASIDETFSLRSTLSPKWQTHTGRQNHTSPVNNIIAQSQTPPISSSASAKSVFTIENSPQSSTLDDLFQQLLFDSESLQFSVASDFTTHYPRNSIGSSSAAISLTSIGTSPQSISSNPLLRSNRAQQNQNSSVRNSRKNENNRENIKQNDMHLGFQKSKSLQHNLEYEYGSVQKMQYKPCTQQNSINCADYEIEEASVETKYSKSKEFNNNNLDVTGFSHQLITELPSTDPNYQDKGKWFTSDQLEKSAANSINYTEEISQTNADYSLDGPGEPIFDTFDSGNGNLDINGRDTTHSIKTTISRPSFLSIESRSSTKSRDIKNNKKSVRSGGINTEAGLPNENREVVFRLVHLGNKAVPNGEPLLVPSKSLNILENAPTAALGTNHGKFEPCNDSGTSTTAEALLCGTNSAGGLARSSKSSKASLTSAISRSSGNTQTQKPAAKTKKRSARGGGVARSGQVIRVSPPKHGTAAVYTIVARSNEGSKGVRSARGGGGIRVVSGSAVSGVRSAVKGSGSSKDRTVHTSLGADTSLTKLFKFKKQNNKEKNRKPTTNDIVEEFSTGDPGDLPSSLPQSAVIVHGIDNKDSIPKTWLDSFLEEDNKQGKTQNNLDPATMDQQLFQLTPHEFDSTTTASTGADAHGTISAETRQQGQPFYPRYHDKHVRHWLIP